MKFSCDQCHAQYMIADEKVGARGVKVKCKKCGNVIVVKPMAAQGDTGAAHASGSDSAPAGATAPATGAFGNLFGGGPGASAGDGLGAGVVGGGLGQPAAGGFGAAPAAFGGGFAGSAAVAASPSPLAPSADFGDINLGALGAIAPAPARRAAGEKEWYIAIDDSQVGPVDLAEIEQRWDAKELDDDSLAWKAGMADWMPVAEIPELAYLVAQRPHPKPQAKLAPVGASSAMPSGGGPVSFGGDGANEDVSWKPSAASALSSLVQEELVAATAPKQAPVAPPAGVPDLPGFGAGDLFSAGGGAQGAGAPARSDPFVPPTSSWAVPDARSRSSRGFNWTVPVFSILGIGILGLLVIVVLQWTKPPQRSAVASIPGPAPISAPQPSAAARPAAPAATPAATQTPPAAAEQRVAAARPKHETVRETRSEVARAETPKEEPREPKAKAASDDPLDGIGGGGGEAKAALTKDDVVNGVKKNAASALPCVRDARMKGELEPKTYTLLLNFVIHADGSVGRGAVVGPPEVTETSLPACFANVMRKWRFPASQKEMPISNYPFGPFTVR